MLEERKLFVQRAGGHLYVDTGLTLMDISRLVSMAMDAKLITPARAETLNKTEKLLKEAVK